MMKTMKLLGKLFLAARHAAGAAWQEGKYSFLMTMRSAPASKTSNIKEEQEAWIKAFEALDERDKAINNLRESVNNNNGTE